MECNEMRIALGSLILLAGACAVPANVHAITVTADGRSMTTAEVCDARFLKDTPRYHRTTPTATLGDERKRWAPVANTPGAQKGELKELCVPSFQYFVFCFKDNEYYPLETVEFLNCRR